MEGVSEMEEGEERVRERFLGAMVVGVGVLGLDGAGRSVDLWSMLEEGAIDLGS